MCSFGPSLIIYIFWRSIDTGGDWCGYVIEDVNVPHTPSIIAERLEQCVNSSSMRWRSCSFSLANLTICSIYVWNNKIMIRIVVFPLVDTHIQNQQHWSCLINSKVYYRKEKTQTQYKLPHCQFRHSELRQEHYVYMIIIIDNKSCERFYPKYSNHICFHFSTNV